MELETKWYKFRQNNSGGRYTKPAMLVGIEAIDETHAIARAEEIGLYWDGCDSGIDCDCCGDRWSKSYVETATRDELITYWSDSIDDRREWAKHDGTAMVALFPLQGGSEIFE